MTIEPAPRPPLDRERLSAVDRARIEVVDEAASTNVLVAERARAGEPAWLVVVAEHQTAGRGRLDRTWETPARSALTFSVLVRPTVPAEQWPWLPLLTGHAVGRTLQARGFAAGVKWPNDLLIDEQKVAGILVERVDTPTGPAGVIGIGLNVSTRADELPMPTATSLAIAGRAPDRTELLLELLDALRQDLLDWEGPGAVALRASYAERCVTIGQQVRVDLPSGEMLTGEAVGIDPGGRLRVRTGDGETAVGAGDVVHVRTV